MKKLTITYENGKQHTYRGSLVELTGYKMRAIENTERRQKLGMETNKPIKFEITEDE
jgi:hypothetical protein